MEVGATLPEQGKKVQLRRVKAATEQSREWPDWNRRLKWRDRGTSKQCGGCTVLHPWRVLTEVDADDRGKSLVIGESLLESSEWDYARRSGKVTFAVLCGDESGRGRMTRRWRVKRCGLVECAGRDEGGNVRVGGVWSSPRTRLGKNRGTAAGVIHRLGPAKGLGT